MVPDFGTQIFLRRDPTLYLEPIILVAARKETASVLETNAKARRQGAGVGMTVAQVRSLVPDLNILLRSTEREQELTTKLSREFRKLAPLVSNGPVGEFYLEIDGLQRLHGDERRIAKLLLEIVDQERMLGRVGIGGNKFVARVAASVSTRSYYTLVPSQESREFLAPQSIKHLKLHAETEKRLLQLGLRTLGQIALFPANELQERLGDEGRRISLLSRGRDPDCFEASIPETPLSNTVYLVNPIYRKTTLQRRCNELMGQVLVNLARDGKTCRCILLDLLFADRSKRNLVLSLASPSQSPVRFARQLENNLRNLTFPDGISEIRVTAIDTPQQQYQQMAFDSGGTELNRFQSDTNSSRCDYSLYRAGLTASSLPEDSFTLKPISATSPSPSLSRAEITPSGQHFTIRRLAGLRLCKPAIRLEIRADLGKPQALKLAGQKREIASFTGPWQLSGNWWDQAYQRSYYEIETSDHRLLLVYFDNLQACWYWQGTFD
jgi:nucleotidyltransferase/DNA polymerase involved in DNA repair